MRAVLVGLLLALAPLQAAEAQRAERLPRRPRLDASADTNDARNYLQQGQRVLEANPTQAADAFYWATRLDPSSADAFYGRRTANLMRRPSVFRAYMEGNRRTVFGAEMMANDSLLLRALHLDPFLHTRFDHTMLLAYFRSAIGDGVNPGEIDFYVERRLQASGPAVRAPLEAAQGRFPYAIDLYSEAIQLSKAPMWLYLERGRLQALRGADQEAILDYQRALDAMRDADLRTDTIVSFYSSKALHEHSVALLHARHGDHAKAKDALGRAMAEDLSFYPAHLELARIALAAKDTANVVTEAGMAAELAPNIGHVQYLHGAMLLEVGRPADAIAPLRKAIELEPFYASPHHALARALDKTGDTSAAREAYTRFLAMAPRSHPERAGAQERLRALGSGTP